MSYTQINATGPNVTDTGPWDMCHNCHSVDQIYE